MSKALVVSDTHFANFPEFATYEMGVNSRLLYQLAAFESALSWGLREKCDVLIHLGDVFHTRGRVEPEVVNLVKETLARNVKGRGGFEKTYILTGNHDITMEGPIFNTAHILNGFRDIDVIHHPVMVIGGPATLVFMPFMNVDAEHFMETLDKLRAKEPKESIIVFMHQSVFGAEYGRDITKGVHPHLFKSYAGAYCGHIHRKQKVGPINIVGSLYPMNFGDVTGRAIIVDLNTGRILKQITPDHPEFLTVKGAVPRDLFNFYRVLDIDPKSVAEVPANMRFVPEVKLAHVEVRFSGKGERALLEHYVDEVMSKDTPANRQKMLELGMSILKGGA